MQPIRNIITTLVGDHPGTIPVHFGQIPISSSREDVKEKKFTHNAWQTTHDDGQRPITIAHPEHLVLRWVKKLKIVL